MDIRVFRLDALIVLRSKIITYSVRMGFCTDHIVVL